MDSVADTRTTTKEINLEIKRAEIKLGRLFDKFGFDNEFEEEDFKEIKTGALHVMERLQKVLKMCDLSIDHLAAKREAEELEESENMTDDEKELAQMSEEERQYHREYLYNHGVTDINGKPIEETDIKTEEEMENEEGEDL